VIDNAGIDAFTINGDAVSLDGSGSFSHTVSLTPGANTLAFLATDPAENLTMVDRTVTYVIDETAPVISNVALQPALGPVGTIFVLECSVVDGDNGVALVEADVRDDGGGLVTTVSLTSSAGSVWSGSISSATLTEGIYSVDLRATDTSPLANGRTVLGAGIFRVGGIFADGFETGTTSRWSAALP
jgi:hypothetical protein